MYDYFEWFTYNNALFGLVVTPVVITKQFGHFLLLPNLPDLPVDYRGILPRCWEWSSDSPWFVCVMFSLGERDTSAKQMWWNMNIPTCRVWTGWIPPDLSYWSAETKDGSGTLQHLRLWKKQMLGKTHRSVKCGIHSTCWTYKKENQSWNAYQSVALFVKPIQGRYINCVVPPDLLLPPFVGFWDSCLTT